MTKAHKGTLQALDRFCEQTSPPSEERKAFRPDASATAPTRREARLDWARQGIPSNSVLHVLIQHLRQPDPELVAVTSVSAALGRLLGLHPRFVFRSNATNAMRDCVDVVMFHELFHPPLSSDLGLHVARQLLSKGSRDGAFAGDLVHTDLEHPSVLNVLRQSWPRVRPGSHEPRKVARLRDAVSASASFEAEDLFRRFEKVLTVHTRCVVLPHVVWFNGAVLPVRELSQRIKERFPAITIVVDGAQAVGHIPADVESLESENSDIDFYVGSGHKWMAAPETVGFARVGSRFALGCSACAYRLSAADIFKDGASADLPAPAHQTGTHQRGLAAAFVATIREFEEQFGSVASRQGELMAAARALRAIVRKDSGLVLLDPAEEQSSGIVSFTGPVDRVRAIHRGLVEVGHPPVLYTLADSDNRAGEAFLRLSPGARLNERELATIQNCIGRGGS